MGSFCCFANCDNSIEEEKSEMIIEKPKKKAELKKIAISRVDYRKIYSSINRNIYYYKIKALDSYFLI